MSEYIVLIQIGPVQSFIAAARKVQDLAVGSALLSNLAKAGVEIAEQAGADMLFPVRLDNGALPNSIPHRFAFTTEHVPDDIVSAITEAIEAKWHEYAQAVKQFVIQQIGGKVWGEIFDRQIGQWLQIVWAAMPYDRENHGDSYRAVSRALSARKAFREFEQVNESGDERGVKCTLTGSQSALKIEWAKLEKSLNPEAADDNILFNEGERLGSLALIKRLLPRSHADFSEYRKNPDLKTIAGVPADAPLGRDTDRYFAVIAMDGDRMGAALSQLTKRAQHQAFSKKLAEFAHQNASDITRKQLWGSATDRRRRRTLLIYAGGDDVLALAPVDVALKYAEDLRVGFEEHMQEYGLHASAGIAISYFKAPLDIALQTARDAEEDAKNGFDRNAVMVRETTHSGMIRDAGGKWVDKLNPEDVSEQGIAFLTLMEQLRASIASHELSARIGQDLLYLAHDIGDITLADEIVDYLQKRQIEKQGKIDDESRREIEKQANKFREQIVTARHDEIYRIVKRRISEKVPDKVRDEIMRDLPHQLIQLGESEHCGWESLAHRVIMARFLAQPMREEQEGTKDVDID